MPGRTSADTSAAFRASYHRPIGAPASKKTKAPTGRVHCRRRWSWFRIEALTACRSRARMTSELCDELEVEREENARRIALRNLSHMVRDGFLVRGEGGYLATERGVRVLADIELLESLEGDDDQW